MRRISLDILVKKLYFIQLFNLNGHEINETDIIAINWLDETIPFSKISEV